MTSEPTIRNPQSAIRGSDDAVIDALREQLECYRRLAKLAQQQHEHVRQDQSDLLLRVLTARQHVLDQIATLERRVSPAKGNWPEFVGKLEVARRTEAETLLAETRVLLAKITDADRNDVLVLQQRKLNVGREINQAAAARQVNRQYAASAYGPSKSRMDVQR